MKNKVVKIVVIISFIPYLLILIIFSHSFEIEKIMEKISAKQMIKNAEEKICFNKSDTYVGGIF